MSESMNRREALARMGAIAAGAASLGVVGCGDAGAGGASTAEAAATGLAGRLDAIGVQLYTVRDEMGKSVPETLRRVAEIGYREVEFAGYFGHEPSEIRTLLSDHGLVSPATHVPPNFDESAWDQVLESAVAIGHRYVIVAWIPENMRTSLDDWRRTAETMNRAGEATRAAGLQYAYHNHDFEFDTMDGEVAFDVFCAEADPELVKIELDLYWIVHAGHDPVAFLDRWPDRVPLVHVKDRTAGGDMVDVGDGVIDFATIFDAPGAQNIRHFIVEHDNPADGSLRSIEAGFRHLSALG